MSEQTQSKQPGKIRRFLKNPLLHFFLLGLVVFGLHAVLNSDVKTGSKGDPHLVEVSSPDIEWLRSTWNKRWGREPMPGELNGLVNAFIREEILYREALSMGLDQHDTVVRRRLAQKMEFLFEDLAEMTEVEDQHLQDWFNENRERYRRPERISFAQIYFNIDTRGENAAAEAEELLKELRNDDVMPSEVSNLGDQSMLTTSLNSVSPKQVMREFGSNFTEDLFAQKSESWQGPLVSPYGLHLVYVGDRVESRMPDFEEVRNEVERDYLSERRIRVNDAAYNDIRSRYTVLLENLPYSADRNSTGGEK